MYYQHGFNSEHIYPIISLSLYLIFLCSVLQEHTCHFSRRNREYEIPVPAVAQNVLKVEPGSKRRNWLAPWLCGLNINQCDSGTLAVLAGSLILGVLPPFVIKMFDFVLPGVFG